MKYKFYTTSEKAWVAMSQEITKAEKSIYLESFILVDDALTHNFFEILKQKARAGVKVKIIVDQIGSFWAGSLPVNEYRQAGIDVLFFRRFFFRNHRKVLIIDNKIAFLGGVNIYGKYAKWFDLHVKITGPLAKPALKSFAKVYQLAGGTDNEILAISKKIITESRRRLYKTKLRLIETWPFRSRSVLKSYYRKKCAEAKNSIIIVTPYFVPHRWLINCLEKAAKRGVSVQIMFPNETDVRIADIANYIFAEELSNSLKFFILPEMNHAKILLIDNKEGMIGSNNIDGQSFNLNLEASIVFQREDMIGDLRKIIEIWKKTAVPFEKNQKKMPWYYGITKFFIKLIISIL
ncbi:MAG: phosphatidylserine/phosphatidylglycerophosphate/cardiolipin synthase family protein [Patescibacteria group bacterium]